MEQANKHLSATNVCTEKKGGFPAGTRIQTDKGLVPIQNIKVGDMVLSKPESGEGELNYKPVVRTVSYENKELWDLSYFKVGIDTDFSELNKDDLLQLAYEGELLGILATLNHPFWVKGIGWTRLDTLKNGDVIEMKGSDTIAVVLMVQPIRETSNKNVCASYSPQNILSFDRRGFDIEDVDVFCFIENLGKNEEIFLEGGYDHSSPLFRKGKEPIHVLDSAYLTTVYNFEAPDYHTYFVGGGVLVHQ